MGQPDHALGYFQRALPAYQMLKDDSAISKTYTYLGVSLKTLGRFGEAERAYQRALSESQASQNIRITSYNVCYTKLLRFTEPA